MANTIIVPPLTGLLVGPQIQMFQGDNSSTTITFPVGGTVPTGFTLVSARNSSNADVSGNFFSQTLVGNNINIVLSTPFPDIYTIHYAVTQPPATVPPLPVTVVGGTITSITNPVAVTGAFFQATQPVSIAAPLTVSSITNPVTVNPMATLGTYESTPPVLTNGQTLALQSDTAGSLYVNSEGRKTTYRASVNAFTPITSGAFPTIVLTGSATKTVRITKVYYQVTGTTGIASYTSVVLQRFSAISGGTAIAVTPATLDTNNAAATAVCSRYTALPTVATVNGGIIDCYSASITTASAANPVSPVQAFDFGSPAQQKLTLRGVNDFVGIRLQNVAAAPSDNFMIEWTEE